MLTFEVFLSFSFLFHFYIHKTIHPWPSMRKTFLCTTTFLYMTNFLCTRIRTLSLYITRSIYEPYSRSKIFSFSPTHTCGSYKSFFIYTRCSHTQGYLSTHYLHTQKSFYTHFPFTYIYKKTFFFFFFFIYVDILFTSLLSFYHDFGSFYFYFGRRS